MECFKEVEKEREEDFLERGEYSGARGENQRAKTKKNVSKKEE